MSLSSHTWLHRHAVRNVSSESSVHRELFVRYVSVELALLLLGKSWAWWLTPAIPVRGRHKQEGGGKARAGWST